MHKNLVWRDDYRRWYAHVEGDIYQRIGLVEELSNENYRINFNNLFSACDMDGCIFSSLEEAKEMIESTYEETIKIFFDDFYDKAKVISELRRDKINKII